MSKLLEILVGIEMERSVSQFLPTRKFGIASRGGQLILVRTLQPEFTILFLRNWLFVLIMNLENDYKMVRAIPLVWPSLIGKFFIFLGYFH